MHKSKAGVTLALLLSSITLSACNVSNSVPDVMVDSAQEGTQEYVEPEVILPNYLSNPKNDNHVCTLYGVNFKLDGQILNDTGDVNGIVTYSSSDEFITDISATRHIDLDNAQHAVNEFIRGNDTYMLEYLPEELLDDTLVYYYYSVGGEYHMTSVYSTEEDTYYTLVPCHPNYLIVKSTSMFYVTLEPQTVTFGDPGEDPMVKRVRNTYEEQAVVNTLRKLSEESSGSDASSGTTLFNTAADVARRSKMLSYATLNWKYDGTNTTTKDTIDTKSPSARVSQWVLKATSQYSHTENGLKLYGLYGTKSNTRFSVQGTVDNLFDTPRPWVIMLKFLDIDNNLVALRVIDYTKKPISGNSSGTFTCELTDEVDLGSITSIQFEMY